VADLPPGFVLDKPNKAQSPSAPALPAGFVLDSASEQKTSYNPLSALGQFASGAVEGNAGLAALAFDLNPFAVLTGQGARISRSPDGGFSIQLPASEAASQMAQDYLPEPDEQYRYSRTIGNFVGPGMAAKGTAKVIGSAAPKLASFLAKQGGRTAQTSALGGALGSQSAEDATGDSAIAPLIGSVFGAASPSVFANLYKTGRSVFKGASQAEIRGSAAKALQELTDLTPQQIDDAIKNMPDDQLGALMTTAELTDNAGMAQIEKTLGGKPEFAQLYNNRSAVRDAARENTIDSISPVSGINREGFGSKIIDQAGRVADDMQEGADAIWQSVPRNMDIRVRPQQAGLARILESRKGGLTPNSKVRTLADQFLNKGAERGGILESGALQDIRSDALSLMRDANLTPFEQRILSKIQQGADEAMELGLTGPDYERWTDARAFTKQKAETFGRGTAGGYLTSSNARPATAFKTIMKGDSKAIKDFRAAVANDPAILEEAKRAFVDLIPRDRNGLITANAMKKFLASNEGAIDELLGKEHAKNLGRVLEDLRSEASVAQKGFAASKGGSVTAQRQSVADIIKTSVGEAATPGARGPFSSAINALMSAAETNNTAAIEDLLFKAALDPFMAKQLAETATDQNVMNLIDRLVKTVKDGATEGTVRGAAIELGSKDKGTAPQSAPIVPLSGSAQNQRSVVQPPQRTGSQLQQQPQGLLPQVRSERGSIQSPSQDLASKPDEIQAVFDKIKEDVLKLPKNDNEMGLLLDAVRQVESGGGKYLDSPAGAQGPYQFMPATAKAYGLEDPYDEVTARDAAMRLINDEVAALGSLELGLAAYNAGRPMVQRAIKKAETKDWAEVSKHLPKETREYVPKIDDVFERLLKGA